MKHVWTVSHRVDWEGDYLLGIFTSEDRANERRDKEYLSNTWQRKPNIIVEKVLLNVPIEEQ